MAGFLRIAHVCCVCPLLRLLITNGMIWTPCYWLNKFYDFYMAVVVGIVRGCNVSIHTHRGNYPSKSKSALFKPLLHCYNHLKQL